MASPKGLPLVSPPLGQFVARPGMIDLAWGHPDPELLPVEALRSAAADATSRWGADLLGYGHPRGPGPLLEALAEHIGTVDGATPDPGAIVATAGASHALDLVSTLLARPGDAVLVEAPTYHVALKLLRDHDLEPVAVPRGPDGVAAADVDATLDALAAQGRRVAFLYLIPTFHNPTGGVMSLAGRRELVDLADRRQLLVVEDEPYRELAFDGATPPALWTLGPRGRVIRLGSFSKTLAPGLRLGFLIAEPAIATRIADSGLLDSGGGIAHFQGLVVAALMGAGKYARHVGDLREAYAARRDSLVHGLAAVLPAGVEMTSPRGGFFVWLTLPADGATGELLDAAEARGVSFVPGPAFAPGRAFAANLRLSFSRYGPADLAEAATRLGAAIASSG